MQSNYILCNNLLFLCSFHRKPEATSPPRTRTSLLSRRSSQPKLNTLRRDELPLISYLSLDTADCMTSARRKKNPQQSFGLNQQQRRLSMLQLQEEYIAKFQRRTAMENATYKSAVMDKFVSGRIVPVPTIKTSPTLPSRIDQLHVSKSIY